MKVIRVTMPDGSKWDVPAEIVARSYANWYAEKDGKTIQESMDEVLNDERLLIEWAEGDMNWADVRPAARQVKKSDQPDYENGWVNGEKEVLEVEE